METARDSEPPEQSASFAAAELIRELIVTGRLEPGTRLKEDQLAKDFGISRTPLREALQRLATEGTIQMLPRRGAVVREYSRRELGELYQLRALLEGHAAYLAAFRISPAQLDELDASCDRFEALDDSDVSAMVKENSHFHEQVLLAADSSVLAAMVCTVTQLPLVYKLYIWGAREQHVAAQHYHRRLAAALRSGEADRAERLMREHLLEARDLLLDRMPDPAE